MVDGWNWIVIKGSRPEGCIASIIYSRDIPFWSETLDIWMDGNGWIEHCGWEDAYKK